LSAERLPAGKLLITAAGDDSITFNPDFYMADANTPSPAAPKRRGWLKVLIWIFGILVVLVVVAYLIGTNSAFFKGVILPKASAALNAKVTVSDASISPFKEVVLKDLKVQTTGTEPLVNAPEVRLEYSLMAIIRGNILVDEVALSTPTITLVQNPDGTSNLDPILKAMKEQPEKPKAPAKPSKTAQIDIRKISLTDGTLRQLKLYGGNRQDVAELSHINVTLSDLKNGQTGKLTLASDIKVENNPPPPGTKGVLNAKLDGNFSLALAADLKPASIQGSTRLSVTKADGAFAQMAAFGATFDCNVTPTEIKQVALRFQHGDTKLGALQVAGPFDMEKTEGRLTAELLTVDKNLLNLTGAGSGVDFGPTTVGSSNLIQLAKGGSNISVAGQFNINQLQLTRTNQTTPRLDLSANYDVNVDRAASTLMLRALAIKGLEKGNPFLNGGLSSPMTISWGNTSNAVGDSALNVSVTHLDLADWKAFLGDVAAGEVNAKLQLLSQQGGKNLSFDLSSEIANLTAGSGSNQITQATITTSLRGQSTDFKQFNIPEYKFQLARASQSLLTASGSVAYDKSANTADVQLTGQVMLAQLMQAFPRPDMSVSSGTAGLKVHVVQKPMTVAAPGSTAATQSVTGSFNLADLTGKVGNNSFQSFGTTADLDVNATPDQVQIRKISGKITQGQAVGGSFDLNGTCNLASKATQLTAKLVNFNQSGLGPFLQSALGDKKLVSIALNADSSVQYDPAGASAIKANLQVTNLVVNDPKGQIPATPLSAGAAADVSMNKQVADLKVLQLALTPTARGSNVVQLTGRVDMTQSNAIQGNLKLTADSLDLTTYYDLFGGQSKTPAKPTATTTTAQSQVTPSSPAGPEQEPPPMTLPLRNFTADANVRRVYLHEIEIADFQASTKLDGGHVVLNPFKMSLNGAPVNSTIDADMGVPGYKYDVSFNAHAIPLAPLVNSFQPDRKGQVGGTLSAQAQVKGAGITGANLQKNLSGQFDIGSTNLNLAVVNIRNPMLRTLVNVVAIVPDLIKNPTSGLGSLVQELTGKSSGGLADDLSKSPVDTITARGTAGAGKVGLQQAVVQSSAFRAEASGTVTLAPILTNSAIEIPVSVYLSRPISQKLNLITVNTPTNAQYVKLPDFLTMKGTAGKPEPVINKLALGSVALQSIGTAIPSGGKTGNLIQGIQGLLGGQSTGTATNAPPASTNQSPVGNLLNQFLKPKK
jgi:uncharacterized protein involved in outer membrane biogenesis